MLRTNRLPQAVQDKLLFRQWATGDQPGCQGIVFVLSAGQQFFWHIKQQAPTCDTVMSTEARSKTSGLLQMTALAFKMLLEEDLLQEMLGSALSGPITADSLARIMQCFGPCLSVAAGADALRPLAEDGTERDGERAPGIEVKSGEICNAQLTAASVGYISSVCIVLICRWIAPPGCPEQGPEDATSAVVHLRTLDPLLSLTLQTS